jgi:hypothetical protein
MPLPDPLTEERFGDLVAELRDARTETPATVTARLEALLALPAPAAPRRRLGRPRLSRRRGLLAVGATVALVCGIGAVVVLRPGGTSSRLASNGHRVGDSKMALTTADAAPAVTAPAVTGAAAAGAAADVPTDWSALETTKAPPRAILAPLVLTPAVQDGRRLQHENASLRIAVPNVNAVSDATGAVTQAVQGYGGYVVTVSFDATRTGSSQIVAKVPFAHVQEAIARFSRLGHVVAEHVDLSDLQRRFDSTETQIARQELRIARLQALLLDPARTATQQATARVRLAQAKVQLARLHTAAAAVRSSAAMSDLQVQLLSRTPVKKAAATVSSTGVATSATDAVGVLGRIARLAVYGLIIASPLLLAGAAWLLVRRRLRTRRERRLLEEG